MRINVDVTHTFNVNGKEYASIEEMPEDVRQAFEKAMASQGGPGPLTARAKTETRVSFNGKEYESIEAMPEDVRRLYEKVIVVAGAGALPKGIDLTAIGAKSPGKREASGTNSGGRRPQTVKVEASFSPRTLMVSGLLAVVFFALYVMLSGK